MEADNSKRQVHYTTIERYPVSNDIAHQLAYPEQICPERSNDFYALHNSAWNTDISLTPYFILHKVEGDFTNYKFQGAFDLIYFDAFAPENNRKCEPGTIQHPICFSKFWWYSHNILC